VSEKGAVSVYGMGRFPVTLYKRAVDQVAGHGGRNSRIDCCVAIESEGINSPPLRLFSADPSSKESEIDTE
jgi:hypothetical protein